jgi:N4-gp56 family major capsid protein
VADSNFDTSNLSAFVKTTYDLAARFALRPELYFVPVATERPTMLAMRGSVVTWTFYPDMAAATSELNETTDPETISVTPTTITATLKEYGNVAKSTAKYRGLSFEEIPGADPSIANLIGYNSGISQDTLARDVLVAGSNVVYGGAGTARNTLTPTTGNIVSAKLRYVAAKLRGGNARPTNGSAYTGFLHPDVTYDLMGETGDAGWLAPANYSAADRRWNGMVGRYAGIDIIETPRAPIFVDASSGSGATGTVDAYASLFVGQEAFAMTWAKPVCGMEPSYVLGPQIDRLRRHHTFGWYWLGAFARFREAALYRLETTSSIGTNA